MTTSTKSVKIAFDNGGGAVLFNRNYAHSYQDGQQLAADVICLLAGGDVRNWDGNDDELSRAMRYDNLDGYEVVYTIGKIANLLKDGLVTVDGDEVTIRDGSRGRSPLSGFTESRFFRAVSAR